MLPALEVKEDYLDGNYGGWQVDWGKSGGNVV